MTISADISESKPAKLPRFPHLKFRCNCSGGNEIGKPQLFVWLFYPKHHSPLIYIQTGLIAAGF